MKRAEAVPTQEPTRKAGRLRRASGAVLKFASDKSEQSKARQARDEQIMRNRENEPRNKQAVEAMRKDTERRTDSLGQAARLFEKVRATQRGNGLQPRDAHIAGAENTYGEASYAGLLSPDAYLSGADGKLFDGSLVLDRDFGVAPTGENVNLGYDVTVRGVVMKRENLVDEQTGQTRESVTLTILGNGKHGSMSTTRDTRLEATFDPSSGEEPVWTQSIRATRLGSPTATHELPQWNEPVVATHETVAAALTFTQELIPPVVAQVPELQG